MDDYCKQHKDLEYCEKVGMRVPESFCRTCKGTWGGRQKENREKYRLPLTEQQKNDKDVVSVIIPARGGDIEYAPRTVKSLYEMAVGPIEVIVCRDGYYTPPIEATRQISYETPVGQRKIMNDAASVASGKYLFRLDAHCSLSGEWDARMKASCGGAHIVVPVFDMLDTKTWKGTQRDIAFTLIDHKLKNRFVRRWKPLRERHIEEDTMGMVGAAWMIQKDYYQSLGGSDESLGAYGAIGTEWPLKVWLTGGRVLIRTDVVCAHLFRTSKTVPYEIDYEQKEKAFIKLYEQWVVAGQGERQTRPIEWLYDKFELYGVKFDATVRV